MIAQRTELSRCILTRASERLKLSERLLLLRHIVLKRLLVFGGRHALSVADKGLQCVATAHTARGCFGVQKRLFALAELPLITRRVLKIGRVKGLIQHAGSHAAAAWAKAQTLHQRGKRVVARRQIRRFIRRGGVKLLLLDLGGLVCRIGLRLGGRRSGVSADYGPGDRAGCADASRYEGGNGNARHVRPQSKGNIQTGSVSPRAA